MPVEPLDVSIWLACNIADYVNDSVDKGETPTAETIGKMVDAEIRPLVEALREIRDRQEGLSTGRRDPDDNWARDGYDFQTLETARQALERVKL